MCPALRLHLSIKKRPAKKDSSLRSEWPTDVILRQVYLPKNLLWSAPLLEREYSSFCYLFTWKRVFPVAKKSTIWRAAARPALTFASPVWAPIFFGVANTR